MKKYQANKIVCGLSDPGKMPCKGYSIPAQECHVGGRLVAIEGSVCHGCYALKGNYTRFPEVNKALYRRFKAIRDPRWVEAMVTLIDGMPFFRWHDSGDIQDEEHLNNIFDICESTPKTKHWIPTREYEIVENVIRFRNKPKNLALRLSGHMINESGPVVLAKRLGVQISEVSTGKYTCPAPKQGNKCVECRHCWNTRRFNVVYHKH